MTPLAPRAAALLISVRVDPQASTGWSASLRGFDDLSEPASPLGEFASREELLAGVRAWIKTVTSQ